MNEETARNTILLHDVLKAKAKEGPYAFNSHLMFVLSSVLCVAAERLLRRDEQGQDILDLLSSDRVFRERVLSVLSATDSSRLPEFQEMVNAFAPAMIEAQAVPVPVPEHKHKRKAEAADGAENGAVQRARSARNATTGPHENGLMCCRALQFAPGLSPQYETQSGLSNNENA